MNDQQRSGSAAEAFAAFLKLGLTSFGGPIAHLGYFRTEFVERRKWLSENSYADIVALCQFLPGPASSQVGFTLGILRGNGLLGGLAAWIAFTMPSAIILFAFALGATAFTGAHRRRRAPRAEARRGRGGGAGDLGMARTPDAGSRAGRDRARRGRDRGFHRRIVWADRRDRARGGRRVLAVPRDGPAPIRGTSAFRYRAGTARSRSCFSRVLFLVRRW